ncbi:MAG: alpha/beta fold hydrolase [Rhodocyclales bacterium]|nr:alpha/beta fold hydrolase [Rhodocyclales bacterium]
MNTITTATNSDCPPRDTQAWDAGWLEVGAGHRLYYEQSGNPAGVPVVVVHGGPGSGCSPRQRELLDPDGYRVILFDQRGSGRSTPRGACADNTTELLVADIEQLRQHLGIARWLVSGGSWGASLGVLYCAHHAPSCLGAILRNVFLTGAEDIAWFFHGAARLRPAAWQRLASLAPARRRDDVASWYLETVGGSDRGAALVAVAHWMQWEAALTSAVSGSAIPLPDLTDEQAALDKYRLQAHYLRNECFVGSARLLALAATVPATVPVALLHGRRDRVCRPRNAVLLRRAIEHACLRFIPGAGHSPFDPPMQSALRAASSHFLSHGHFDGWPRSG